MRIALNTSVWTDCASSVGQRNSLSVLPHGAAATSLVSEMGDLMLPHRSSGYKRFPLTLGHC